MGVDPSALLVQCHAKAQGAPRKIFGTLLPNLRIFLIPPYPIKKTKLDDFMRHCFMVMHDELRTVKAYILAGWAR